MNHAMSMIYFKNLVNKPINLCKNANDIITLNF